MSIAASRYGLLSSATYSAVSLCMLAFLVNTSTAYPIYDAEESGIARLKGYQNAQMQKQAMKLVPGALLSVKDIHLSLMADAPILYEQIQTDTSLQKAIDSIFKQRDSSYSIVVVDLSDPKNIVKASIKPDNKQNVGSVNKIVTMLGVFDALANAFPEIDDRKQILKNTTVLAGDWIRYDEHKIPNFDVASQTNTFSIVSQADAFNLAEWIDHMVSPSANAAGSVVWREAMLLQQFGKDYPVDANRSNDFFTKTPKPQLHKLSLQVQNSALTKAGINTDKLQQGSFWTSSGKSKVPGSLSYATPSELARFLLLMEQGRLVDSWTSLEMKRYLYMTKRRYRYVYAPEFNQSAVFFKSGSLYQCMPEENFRCAKYMGNKTNLMNSVAIIESLPSSEKKYRYIVALMSNVLKVNSAWDHSRLAAAIHQAVLTRSKVTVQELSDQATVNDAGNGDG